ncbi:titin homolog isoform X2 [Bombus pascuorum]|uniref:titin homolog isoform X2 n=1 Tax=Bombus pascuorum TaxID=65598 RepID=UPI00298EB781|nr:titin homolog isoform X2 [Bombus pascuorum]
MSSSGYRGRSFGPRGARTNGPANGFNVPRYPHPSFNHPRPPYRLPGPEKWIERPNFPPWQQNKNFHLQYRGNLQYRPSSRGRTIGSRGIIRFSGPGRPTSSQFHMGFIRNPIHTALLPQEELIVDKPVSIPQTPLLGSEEERQQKIAETADKLKKKLSSITEQEITNFWEDDLPILPNNGSEEETTRNKIIPELRHEPPELNLTFTDLRDIGRIDCNNLKFGNVDNESNNEISIGFEKKSTDNVISKNNDITITDGEESLIILDSCDKDDLKQTNKLLEDDKCHEQIHNELSDFKCNIENLQLQDNNIPESLISSNSNNVNEKLLTLNLDENITNLLPTDSVNISLPERALDINDIETSSISVSTTDDQNELKIDFLQNQNTVQIHIQDPNRDNTQDTNINIKHNNHTETKLLEDNQIQNNLQRNVPQEVIHQNLENVSDCPRKRSLNFLSSSEEIHSNSVCDSTSSTYSNYEANKLNDDKKLNNPPVFQSKVFNIPPRLTLRIGGPRGHWVFQQNGKNSSFRGSQRLSFHGNRIPPPRHIASFKSTDLVSVGFDPLAPPPFMHNVPVLNHDCQHNPIVLFSSNDLPPAFDPSEPPPNIRSKSGTEPSNKQETIQSMPSLDLKGQTLSTCQNNLKVIQQSPAFDLRGPPPRISNVSVTNNEKIPEFNPQHPPPKIHKREETLQPPPIFDPRLSSQERSNLLVPLDVSMSTTVPLNLMDTSPASDFNIGPIVPNFAQLPPINIPSRQSFISNVQMNFSSVISQTSSGQEITREFPLPLPPMNITEVLLPPSKEPSVGENSNPNQSINMDDGLEDMQEAMEFAKQIMNLTEETNDKDKPTVSELPLTPSKIPIPIESIHRSLSVEEGNTSNTRRQRKYRNKKSRQNVVCGPELICEKQEDIKAIDEEQSVQNQSKNTENALLANDQIRPKVMFNLNFKTKKIHKPEEWHKTVINISENREILQQSAIQNSKKERAQFRKHSSESKNNTNENKNKQKEAKINKNADPQVILIHEKSNDTCYRYKNCGDLEKLHAHSSNTTLTSSDIDIQKNQKSKKESGKKKVFTPEALWKERVISRFLKMSKNDICNMVNNSSLRKFDIAMEHLVKERRSSLSLELRNMEDEKMKEYDRIEFMNQLNAMLDPSAVVGITDLPTEFIHHLSEVLQLDIPFDTELSESQNVDIEEIKIINQNENLGVHSCEDVREESLRIPSFTEYQDPQDEEHAEDKSIYSKEESTHYSLNTESNVNILRQDTNSSHRSLSNDREIENAHKKQQQPLFNEADLDDILSQVTERTKSLSNASLPVEPEKSIDTGSNVSLVQTVTEAFEYNTFSQIPNKTVADLDDIFSAGIVRVKQLGKSNADIDHLRARKSSSEDRNTLRHERYERWKRKEREDPDTFRNLTKEEWEAKYGLTNTLVASTIVRKNTSNSAENLSKDERNNRAPRYCSSDSPMRHLSISPLTREVSARNLDRYISDPSEIEELQTAEESTSSSETSSSNFSDSDEETVSSNVTKLLKVIKEKEKIAKQKSLNETIRDEVVAEIEKEWKEKSKHKERKSRKREKRKKDKKEKRRKEKRKKRKRNSYSGSSKSSEQTEEFRVLTEDEIKKEVIVKEESMSSFEENASLNDRINNTSVNKSADALTKLQSLQTEEDCTVHSVTSETVSSQPKNKPTIVSVVTQRKTKAQLKQVPESNNAEQRQIMEKLTEFTENNTVNVDNGKTKDLLEMNKDYEIATSNNERINRILSMNISLCQTNVPLLTEESSPSIQSHSEAISDNDTTHIMSFTTHSSSNLVLDTSTNNQSVNQKACTTTYSVENKSGGYKKIDIKAYKERALQRRLNELGVLKKAPANSASLIRESHHSLPTDKSNVESLEAISEIKSGIDTNKEQLTDPRLSMVRSTSTPTSEDSDKEGVREKNNLEEEHQTMDVAQETKKAVNSIQPKNFNQKNETRCMDIDSNAFKDFVKRMERRNDNKSLSKVIVEQEFDEFSNKEKSKLESEKKPKKPISDVDPSKFKNIRSEGSKELKLKKEKAKKSCEKKKKSSKSDESKSIEENPVEKHSHKKTSDGNKKVPIVSSHASDQSEVKKTSSHNIHENLFKLQTVETCSGNAEATIDSKTLQKQVNTHSVVRQNNQVLTDSNRETVSINKNVAVQDNEIIISNQQVLNEEIARSQDQNLISSENAKKDGESNKEMEEHPTKVNEMSMFAESMPAVTLNKQKDICNDMSSVGSTSVGHIQSIPTEKCMTSTPPLVSNYVSEESHSLSEQIDVDIEKHGHTINTKNLQNPKTADNSTLDTRIHSKVIVKNYDMNVETIDVEEQDRTIFRLSQKLRTLDNFTKVLKNEVKSPDSRSSPFKGFLADTIDNDICQVSLLYHTKMNNTNIKENTTKEDKDPNQCVQTCFNDKSIIESKDETKGGEEDFSEKMDEENETSSISNLAEEQQNVTEKTTDHSLNVEDNTKIDDTTLEIKDKDITTENDQTCDLSAQSKFLFLANVDNGHDTLDEDNQSFIVLDEYIDETDEKSIKKLSSVDLDLEDCIARDADVFTTKSLQKFTAVSPPELFAAAEKTGNTTNLFFPILPSNENLEANSKILKTTKPINSINSEISVEYPQNIINATSENISQKCATIEPSSITEIRVEERNEHCTNVSEDNLLHNLQSSCATEPVVTSLESESSQNLNVPIKIARRKSTENFENTAPIPETNKELLELKKQQQVDNNLLDKQISVPCEISTSIDRNLSIDCNKEYEARISNKLNKKDKSKTLNNIDNKSKKKYKKRKPTTSKKIVKEAMTSDNVKIKHPTMKEAVMARMIEIDVEIHKLMTEKMTLYQMLTSDTLPNDNNLQQNNVTREDIEVETPVIRPRTPSTLMTQLLQNIEPNPVANQCAKTTTESSPTKESPINPIQPNKSKTLYKHDHHAEKRGSCTSTCGSDDEEMAYHAENTKSSKKRKRQSSETVVVKRLENKSDSQNVCTKDTQSTVTEKKQVNNAIKATLKKINTKRTTIEQNSDQVSANETIFQEDINKDIIKSQETENIGISVEPQILNEDTIEIRIPELNKENYLTKDCEDKDETSNKTSNDVDLVEKPMENKTPERSSIYSDDSTWDSLLQNPSTDDQKKSNTGLALLEETYKKEIAKTRRIRAEARRKKKKKLKNLLQIVNTLTPDEEELPLSALYARKLHQKKQLLDSFEQQTKQQTGNDPQLWKNVVEVINAVAENRTKDLYVESSEKRLTNCSESVVSAIPNPDVNSEFRDKEKQIINSSLRNIKEVCIEPLVDVNISDNKNERNNVSKKDDLQMLSSKSQEFLNNEYFQQDLEISVSSNIVMNLSETCTDDTSINIEANLVKSFVQQDVENDNVKINRSTSIKDSDSCLTESNSNNVRDGQNISNVLEYSEKAERKTNMETMESTLQNRLSNTDENIATQEPTNSQFVRTSEDTRNNYDTSTESNNDKNIDIMDETTSKDKFGSKLENVNEANMQDSLVLYDVDNNVDNTAEEFNCIPQNERLISLREHKESHKRKDIERFDKTACEENNNQNCASVSSFTENTEALKSDEVLSKKSCKHKRGGTKTAIRRSSRYAEEPMKRVKVEIDVTVPNIEQEEKNFRMQFPSTSPCEEVETILINSRRNRNIQKPITNRKRRTPILSEVDVVTRELNSNNESLKGIKRQKKHTMSEMMNCMVRIVDCRHTILNPNVNLDVLQNYGISKINTYVYSNPTQMDSSVSLMESTSTKDLPTVCKTTSLSELPRSQALKLIKKFDDTTRLVNDQINSIKIKKIPRSTNLDPPVSNKEECADPDIEVMPVLAKEPITVDIIQNCDKPDIEIVEEKTIVTKNQQHGKSGSTLTAIDINDDKELPRTQYTVHKGPILDIKVKKRKCRNRKK